MSASLVALAFIASTAGSPMDRVLVATDDLHAVSDALVVDVRPLKEYQAGHIPGAVHLDANSLSEIRDGVKGLLRPLDQLIPLLEQAGIGPLNNIILYGAMEEPVPMTAPYRVFWILEYLGFDRVAVLDGGIGKWTAEGRPLEKGDPKPARVILPDFKPRSYSLAGRDDVKRSIADDAGLLLDLRPPEFFAGEKKKDYVAKPGHIPKAVNVSPAKLLSGPHNTLAEPGHVAEVLKDAGVTKGTSVITYCNSGRSASLGYFALRLAGYDNIALYDGSMAEWTSSQDCPVEVEQKQ